jgi:nicotinamide mononucleotide (NMN) deamidase PncC
VGLVFIAVVGQNGKSVCAKALYPSDRSTFKRLASQRALDMLRLELLSKRE